MSTPQPVQTITKGTAYIGRILVSTATGIVADLRQTQANATPLTAQINRVTTVANSGDAVKLPYGSAGGAVTIINDGDNPTSVFPADPGDTIDGGATGGYVTLTNGNRAIFHCISTGIWISTLLGAPSS